MFNSWPERIFSLYLSLRLQILSNSCPGYEAVFPRRAVLRRVSDIRGGRGRILPFPEKYPIVSEQWLWSCYPIPWLPSPYTVDNAFLLCFTSCWDFLLLRMSLSQCANFVLTQTVSVEKCFFRYVCSVTCAINSGGLRTDALEANFPHWANITLEAGHREAASLVIAETQPARGWLLPGNTCSVQELRMKQDSW